LYWRRAVWRSELLSSVGLWQGSVSTGCWWTCLHGRISDQSSGPVLARNADLGKGLVVYPAIGLAALVCSLGAAVLAHFDRSPKSAALPLYLAAVTAVIAFVVTRFLLAPEILNLRSDSPDFTHLQNAFVLTRHWWHLKAGLHTITFVCNVWGLIELMSR